MMRPRAAQPLGAIFVAGVERSCGLVRILATIIRVMRLLWERATVLVEPSGAAPLAAVLAYRDCFEGQRIRIVLSGGNANLDKMLC